MKPNHTLNGLIPRPVRIVPNDVRLPATALDRVHLDADTGAARERLLAAFAFYGKNLTPTERADASASLVLDRSLQPEGWTLE